MLTAPSIILSVIIVIVSFLLAKLLIFIFSKIEERFIKEASEFHEIFESIKSPITVSVVGAGFYFALKNIDPKLILFSHSLENVFVFISIFVGAYFISRIIGAIIKWYGISILPKTKTTVDDKIFPFVRKFISVFVYVVALIIFLNRLGVEIGPLLAGLGIAGLAIALALQDTLANFFAGIYILSDKPIRVGDRIKFDNYEGIVIDVGWRTSKILTDQNHIITIPNSKLSQNVIINYDMPEAITTTTLAVSVAYNSNVKKVEKALSDIAKKVINKSDVADKTFVPLVRFTAFEESSIRFTVIFKVKTYIDQFLVQHELRKAILEAFKKNRIDMPYPTRTVYIKRK